MASAEGPTTTASVKPATIFGPDRFLVFPDCNIFYGAPFDTHYGQLKEINILGLSQALLWELVSQVDGQLLNWFYWVWN